MQPLASVEQSQPTVAQQDPAPFEARYHGVPKSRGVPSTIKDLPNESFTTEESFIEDGLSLGARQNSMIAMVVSHGFTLTKLIKDSLNRLVACFWEGQWNFSIARCKEDGTERPHLAFVKFGGLLRDRACTLL